MSIKSLLQFLDRQRKGAIYLDREFTIVASNQLAKKVLSSGRCLISVSGKLRAEIPSETEKLQHALCSLTEQRMEKVIFIRCRKTSQPFRVECLTIEDSKASESSNGVLVVVEWQTTSNEILSNQLQNFFELTDAEIELVKVLSRDVALKEYAKVRGIGVNTVRWTLSNVFSKTNTHSQKQLKTLTQIFHD